MLNASYVDQLVDRAIELRWYNEEGARAWFREFINRRGWTGEQLYREMLAVSCDSPGATVQRPTVTRIERWLSARTTGVPRWVFWCDLADKHAEIGWPDNIAWRAANAPGWRDPDPDAAIFLTSDEEKLISRYRALNDESRFIIRWLADLRDDQIDTVLQITNGRLG